MDSNNQHFLDKRITTISSATWQQAAHAMHHHLLAAQIEPYKKPTP